MHHVHESPWVMLLPLFVLALGAMFAGWLVEDFFVGDERAEFWRSAILVLPQHDSIARGRDDLHGVIDYLPLIAGVTRHRDGLCLLYRSSPTSRRGSRCSSARCICSC